ncbi:uncharacterized protein LOC112601924 [Melanaphis sacchari]|uniref:uncharacterized protein LOC112601924 n=1 Tax=Melanaphis sacchari TaxID=742174 RepID=UPI000DC12E51|nr:uncharacterized protein LOC112601924 [Melanaphis sacchari]
MSGNKFRDDSIDDQVTPITSTIFSQSSQSSSKVANRRKRCEQRIQWLVKNDKSQKYNGEMIEEASIRPTIHHSITSTDLTRTAFRRVSKPYDNNKNSVADTESVEARSANDHKCCERYGLVATPGCTGTFRMSIVGNAVLGPEAKYLIEFTVWKTMTNPGQRKLWFTVRHAMSPKVAVGIRALEVWADRKDDYPAKVVFLQK